MIRDAKAEDAAAIARIYGHYIANTIITFEETHVSDEEIRARLQKVSSARLPWLVYEENGAVVGYAYASRWHERSAYRFSVETTIYLDAHQIGRGLGTALYATLLERLRAQGLHAAIGGIALPNTGSVALHEKLGFRQVAHYREVGFKLDRWIDVGYWQLLLSAPSRG